MNQDTIHQHIMKMSKKGYHPQPEHRYMIKGYADTPKQKNFQFTFLVYYGQYYHLLIRLIHQGYKFRAAWGYLYSGSVERYSPEFFQKLYEWYEQIKEDKEVLNTFLFSYADATDVNTDKRIIEWLNKKNTKK